MDRHRYNSSLPTSLVSPVMPWVDRSGIWRSEEDRSRPTVVEHRQPWDHSRRIIQRRSGGERKRREGKSAQWKAVELVDGTRRRQRIAAQLDTMRRGGRPPSTDPPYAYIYLTICSHKHAAITRPRQRTLTIATYRTHTAT